MSGAAPIWADGPAGRARVHFELRNSFNVQATEPKALSRCPEMTRELPKETVLPLIPLRRFGSAAEVAGAVSFLCGPDSTYIHGQVIAVNGGLVI